MSEFSTEEPRPGLATTSFKRWLLFTFLVWLALAAATLVKAQKEARAGEVALRSVADLSDPIAIDLDVVAHSLEVGQTNLASAEGRLNSSILWPLRPFPVIGRQLASTRALVGAARELTEVVQPLIADVQTARNDSNGLDRIAFLRRVADQLGDLEQVVASADLGPEDGLIGPLAEGRTEMATQLAELADRGATYRIVTDGLAAFLEEGDYLLLGSNNAEMRLGSGMHLSVGRLTTSDGRLDLVDLTPSAELVPVVGARLIDEDVAARWGFLDIETDFRKLGYSARFDEFVAPQALEMWQAKTGESLDGVILLDPFVLEALSGVLGDVTVEGETYDRATLLSYLLRDQYDVVGEGTGDAENEARRDRLALLAGAMSESFDTASWDPLDLIQALAPVARGRHLMVYSVEEAEQRGWEEMGVAGQISGHETGVFWLNTGASKLDSFLAVDVQVTTAIVEDGRELSFVVQTTSSANAGISRYVLGPWETLGVPEPGAYRGRFALYAPNDATDVRFAPSRPLDVQGPDGRLWLMSSEQMIVRPGRSTTIRFEYTVPVERTSIEILPSGRFPLVTWNWDGQEFDDAERRLISLDD